MKVSNFDYHLPTELIAQKPIEPRDTSRLMIVDRKTGEIAQAIFRDLPDFLSRGDCLVLNDTRVFPARLKGHKAKTKGKAEVLLLSEITENVWQALVKPGKRLSEGTEIIFNDGLLVGQIQKRFPNGERLIFFKHQGKFKEILYRLGEIALPPYIHQPLEDAERYQTIYAEKEGSTAAPTAGLHFTDQLLQKLRQKGANFVTITLHVGLDTFCPVQTIYVEDHKIHNEFYEVSEKAAKTLSKAIKENKRIIAVGTTSVRVLETVAKRPQGSPPSLPSRFEGEGEKGGNQEQITSITAGRGWTDLFIYPGYKFKIVDGLLTNFHLPRSTLLILVSAFAGRELVVRAYQQAIEENYRFFSFGDAMLVL